MNKKNNIHNISYGIYFKIILTRTIIIWEKIVKYVFLLLGIILFFIILTLHNFFSIAPFEVHIFLLSVFLLSFSILLIKIIFSLRWPDTIQCARRIEVDNFAVDRPLSTLFDEPALNKDNHIWDTHYNRMLIEANKLGYFKLKSVLTSLDPLYIRFPLLLIFVLTVCFYNNNFISKVEAAFVPQNNQIIFIASELTGWISPPAYTKIPPIILNKEMQHISSPQGSILTAKIFGGKGKIQLFLDDRSKDFVMIDKDNYAIESMIYESSTLTIKQNDKIIFSKPVRVIEDEKPSVEILDRPERTVKGILKIAYLLQDDYGISNLYAHIVLKNKIDTIDMENLNFSVPFDEEIKGKQFGEYYHDLTEHIWAGMPVKLVIWAEDFIGNRGKSEEYELILPERYFTNLIAISIINLRKNLGLNLLNLDEIKQNLDSILEDENLMKEFFIAKRWLLEVSKLLEEIDSNLSLDDKKYKKSTAIKQLWKAALFIESGQLVKAEEDLRRAQENLKKALTESGDAQEIQENIDNLDEALGQYLDEVEDPINVDAPQASVSDDPGDRGGESGAQPNEERQDLEERLEDIADLAVSGSIDEAQKQLQEMQDITEAIDREELGEALGEQEEPSQPMAMQQISEMIEEQQALMENSFEQSLNSAQADQKTPGSGPINAAKEQEALRKQLEDVMKEIAESETPIPEELGRADRAMKQAARDLNRNRPDRAQSAQGRAIEELKKAAESIDKMHSGKGPSQISGKNRESTSRDQRDPLGRVPPGQGSSPGGDVGLPTDRDITKARKIAKELYKKAEKSLEGSIERIYVDSLLDWY